MVLLDDKTTCRECGQPCRSKYLLCQRTAKCRTRYARCANTIRTLREDRWLYERVAAHMLQAAEGE